MVWIIGFKLWPLYLQYSYGERPEGRRAGVDLWRREQFSPPQKKEFIKLLQIEAPPNIIPKHSSHPTEKCCLNYKLLFVLKRWIFRK
jgi:hypothetical protein